MLIIRRFYPLFTRWPADLSFFKVFLQLLLTIVGFHPLFNHRTPVFFLLSGFPVTDLSSVDHTGFLSPISLRTWDMLFLEVFRRLRFCWFCTLLIIEFNSFKHLHFESEFDRFFSRLVRKRDEFNSISIDYFVCWHKSWLFSMSNA